MKLEELKHWLVLEMSHRQRRGRGSNRDRVFKVKCRCCGKEMLRTEPELKLDQPCRSCKFLPQGEAGLKKVFAQYKKHGKERTISMLLSFEEFKSLVRQPCHYCGRSPSNVILTTNEWGKCEYNGVDRKDNRADYTLENSVPCCKMCNWAKGRVSYYEFIAYLDQIARYRQGATNEFRI